MLTVILGITTAIFLVISGVGTVFIVKYLRVPTDQPSDAAIDLAAVVKSTTEAVAGAYEKAYSSAYTAAQESFYGRPTERADNEMLAAAERAIPVSAPEFEPPWAAWGDEAETQDFTDKAIRNIQEGPRAAMVTSLPDFTGEMADRDGDKV